jgi:hypothetical protein
MAKKFCCLIMSIVFLAMAHSDFGWCQAVKSEIVPNEFFVYQVPVRPKHFLGFSNGWWLGHESTEKIISFRIKPGPRVAEPIVEFDAKDYRSLHIPEEKQLQDRRLFAGPRFDFGIDPIAIKENWEIWQLLSCYKLEGRDEVIAVDSGATDEIASWILDPNGKTQFRIVKLKNVSRCSDEQYNYQHPGLPQRPQRPQDLGRNDESRTVSICPTNPSFVSSVGPSGIPTLVKNYFSNDAQEFGGHQLEGEPFKSSFPSTVVDVSSDGKTVGTLSYDNQIVQMRIWDIQSGKLRKTGRAEMVRAFSMYPNVRFIGKDTLIGIYDRYFISFASKEGVNDDLKFTPWIQGANVLDVEVIGDFYLLGFSERKLFVAKFTLSDLKAKPSSDDWP